MSKALVGMSHERYASIQAQGAGVDSSAPTELYAAVPSFVGKGAYTGAVLELEKILDKLFQNPSPTMKGVLENLPPDKFKRLMRLHKSLQNAQGGAFKWASLDEVEKEAFLGFGKKPDSLTQLDRVLKKYEQQTGEKILDLPPVIQKRLTGLGNEVERQLAKRPEEPKGLFEKGLERGQDLGKAVGEKARGVGEKVQEMGRAVGEKARGVAKIPGKLTGDIQRRYQQFQQERAEKRTQMQQAQEEAESTLNKYLGQKTPFVDIFYSLPPEISRELQDIGLTPDNIKASVARKPSGKKEPTEVPLSEQPQEIAPSEQLAKVASDVVLKYLKAQTSSAEKETFGDSAVESFQPSPENRSSEIESSNQFVVSESPRVDVS